jgi:hypothetical protein
MEPSRGKSICVPFDSEEHYAVCVADPESFRQHLTEVFGQHPELFPARMSEGFVLQDKSWSIKQQVMLRRLELKAPTEVFLGRPSFLRPSMVGRTAAVEKALYLRHWGVPFDALVYVFGRDAMYGYRAELALGRPTIVGSPVKQPEKLPAHVRADEKHTWALGQEVYVATTVGDGCILGATVTDAASADALEAAYGECAQEARALSPTYSPKTVCPDGWEGTQSAWRHLFPTVCIIPTRSSRSPNAVGVIAPRVRSSWTGSGRSITPAPGRSSPRGGAVCASGPRRACQKARSGRWSANSAVKAPSSRAPIASLGLIVPPTPSIGS